MHPDAKREVFMEAAVTGKMPALAIVASVALGTLALRVS